MDGLTAPGETRLGADGEHCPQCDAPLHSDQRYCLNCGRRRGAMRLPFADIVTPRATASTAHAAPPVQVGPGERSPLVALGALIALLLALGIGVLLGRGAGDGRSQAASAPIITVGVPATGAAAPATEQAAFVGDWPRGTEGYTISLTTLPATAAASEVTQAKQDATGKGASAVGALKSDEYPSLPAGQIIVYSGSYPTRAAATTALKRLRAAFPAAEVVHVASGAGGDAAASGRSPGRTRTPAQGSGGTTRDTPGYGKSTGKAPPTVQTPGTAPPVDDKPAGGGSGEATEIG